ncbi:MAG: diaminopimelate epimerase [Rhodoferax sp.]
MQITFTKMHGAGNDFVVLDETRTRYGLTPAQYRFLADRHRGVGADQILSVRPPPRPDLDFEYIIHNADGAEVEQCGNGARCFARYVRDAGLTTQDRLRVLTRAGVIEPELQPDGRVRVNMGTPVLDLPHIPFDPAGLQPEAFGSTKKWPLTLADTAGVTTNWIVPVSMGNPHAVQWVDDVAMAPVAWAGALIERHPAFPNRVNAGFMQVCSASAIRLRVFERGAGETLACGSGACAAVVAGRLAGVLGARVDVHTRGGILTIEWAGGQNPVFMTGPATPVFQGQITLPDHLPDFAADPWAASPPCAG